jgi:type III pantothenate kinase
MLLAIDVGNSNTSLGVFDGEVLRCELRLSTQRSWTRDEVAVTLERVLALAGVRLEELADAVVACVVPPALAPLLRALSYYAGLDALVVEPGLPTGMPILYDPPGEVGADRLVAAVAAHDRYGTRATGPVGERGVLVVDFGTATTFDVVSPRPEYLGGVIAPGIGISADALFARAARLPRVDIARPARVIGKNTVAAVQSGLMFGYVGLVEGVVRRVKSELAWPVRVVATGGFAADIAAETECIDIVDESLVLEGLRLVHLRNRGS